MSRNLRWVFLREAALGAVVWFGLWLSSFLPGTPYGIIEILFFLAPWVVVPLGASLLVQPRPSRELLVASWMILPAAALVTVSFFVERSLLAACLASSWVLVCLIFFWNACGRLWISRGRAFVEFCFATGEGYLLVAALWLVASRAGLHPFGFLEPIVLLTAVHFHFAGFASALLAGLTYDQLRCSAWVRGVGAAAVGVVCGPGILGLAFLAGPRFKLAAALLIAVSQFGLAAGMLRVGLHARLGRRLLFGVAGGSVLLGMLLAATWAIGEYPLQPFVDIRQMAEFHGVLNALGFTVCGLLGWAQLR
jgi:hypothetical protein